MRKGLFAKYFALVAGAVSMALLSSGSFGTWMAYREAIDRQQALQVEVATAAANTVQSFFRGIEHDIAWPDLVLSGMQAVSLEERQVALATLMRQSPAIAEAAWVDPFGQEILRMSQMDSNVSRKGTPWADDEAFRKATKGALAYGRVEFRLDSEPYITVAVPSRLEPGWVTVAKVNLKFVQEVVDKIKVGNTGLAYVVDPAGVLIAHPDISLVLKRVSTAQLPQVQAAQSAQQADHIASTMAVSLSGEPVLTTHAPMPMLGWKVFVELPRAEALEPLYITVRFIVLFLVAGVAASILVASTAARRMVRPIQRLNEGAIQIGQGQLDHVIDVHSGDELESLADQFNHMSTRLKESYENLEGKVEQRTRELVIAKEEAEEAHRVKSNFLATMNHEIRTPLTAMLGMAYLALHSDSLEAARGYMARMHMAGDNLQGMINSVLDFSKLEADKVELEQIAFDLPRVFESARDLMGDRASEKGVLLNLELNAGLPKFVMGDQVRILQVINNLVSNAIKFTPKGEVAVGAEIRSRDGAAVRLHMWVRDSGIGMSPEQLKNMFRPFTQADASITRKYGGTGLGLTICKRLVELMEGSISVESEYGKGTVFHVEIPLQLAEAPPPAPSAQNQVIPRIDGIRILLAEDNLMNQELIMAILQRQGASVVVANDGREVMERLREASFDLVLMDYHMPEMNGAETTVAMRAIPEFAALPVVAMTASTELDVLHAMQDAGINDCVAKPLVPAVALATILRWAKPA